jgi:hypothetical protein
MIILRYTTRVNDVVVYARYAEMSLGVKGLKKKKKEKKVTRRNPDKLSFIRMKRGRTSGEKKGQAGYFHPVGTYPGHQLIT